jgi:hypothetical protein
VQHYLALLPVTSFRFLKYDPPVELFSNPCAGVGSMRISILATAVLLCSCTFTTLALAQSNNGSSNEPQGGVLVQGIVESSHRVPIPQLQVSLRNVSNGNIAVRTSKSTGAFQFVAPAGTYLLSAVLGTETATQKVRSTDRQRILRLTIPSRKGAQLEQRAAISISQLNIPPAARRALEDGLAASVKNQIGQAMGNIDRAIDLYPQYAMALATRAALERSSNPQQALMDAQRATEFDPNLAAGYAALGSVYTEYGRFGDAVRTLNRAIAINPDAWLGYYEMFRALVGMRDYSAAIVQLQRTCNLIPKNYAFLHLAKADMLIGVNDRASAIREVEAYLKEAPDGPEYANAAMALARLRAGRLEPTLGALQLSSGERGDSEVKK